MSSLMSIEGDGVIFGIVQSCGQHLWHCSRVMTSIGIKEERESLRALEAFG